VVDAAVVMGGSWENDEEMGGSWPFEMTWGAAPGNGTSAPYGHLHIAPIPPVIVATIAASMLCALVTLLCGAAHIAWNMLTRSMGGGLKTAAPPEETWVLVEFEWGVLAGQSMRISLDGVSSVADLISAVVGYGKEIVGADPALLIGSVDLKFTNQQGVERHVGPETRFVDIQHCRVLRVSTKDHARDALSMPSLRNASPRNASPRSSRRTTPLPMHDPLIDSHSPPSNAAQLPTQFWMTLRSGLR